MVVVLLRLHDEWLRDGACMCKCGVMGARASQEEGKEEEKEEEEEECYG